MIESYYFIYNHSIVNNKIMNAHARILNWLIFRHNYKSYLEIGLDNPADNYEDIMAPNKESCDPYIGNEYPDTKSELSDRIKKNLTYHMTSDEMFKNMPADKKYDLIFVDGLHEGRQAFKDIINALGHLNPNGLIVVHDCLPAKEMYADYPYVDRPERHYENGVVDGTWNGSTWKALMALKANDIKFETLDVEFGLGLIRPQQLDLTQMLYNEKVDEIPYSFVFDKIEDRNGMLNVISEDTFLKNY